MTKEEIKQLENQIKDFIKTLDQYNNEELVHFYKISLKRDSEQRGLYTSLIKAIEQIRQKKNFVVEVSGRGASLEKTTEEIKVGSKIQYKNKKGAKK
jgi:septal ring factor EnvC (AmiA/AmiB activator)